MAITVCPVTTTFAAEIGDVDLSQPLAPDDLAAINDAFATYAVLIFPDQHLSADQHLDFARNFGPLETTIAAHRKDAKLPVGRARRRLQYRPRQRGMGRREPPAHVPAW